MARKYKETKQMLFYLGPETAAAFKEYCRRSGRKISDTADVALAEYLQGQGTSVENELKRVKEAA